MKWLPVFLFIPFIACAQWDDNDRLTADFHSSRRSALRNLLPEKSVAVFFSNPVRNRANNVDYQYHQDPNFYYLTGHLEPNSAIFIFKEDQSIGKTTTNEIIFIQEKDAGKELWTGKRLGVDSAARLGIKTIYRNSELPYADIDFKSFKKVFIIYPTDPNVSDAEKTDLLKMVSHVKSKTGTLPSLDLNRLNDFMEQLREVKQEEELVLMQKAIDMTLEGFREMIRTIEPGHTEYQAQAIGEYFFKKNGSEYPGYGSICGGGHNGCVLHYVFNRKTLDSSDLLLIDMGAEYHGYTADITRTFPVDGHFSEEESALYQLVYNAQASAFEKCLPGNGFREPHIAAFNVIADGLISLGIILSHNEADRYFMHGTSHYLGLDVHDAGTFGPLKPNTVITVEPGIYIPEGSPCDKKWWNKGIRIEDDVLITGKGYKILSAALPRSIEEIEMLMKEPGLLQKSIRED